MSGYDLETAMEIEDVTPAEARKEIEKHGASWDEFLADVGVKSEYTGEEVLGWLGY